MGKFRKYFSMFHENCEEIVKKLVAFLGHVRENFENFMNNDSSWKKILLARKNF